MVLRSRCGSSRNWEHSQSETPDRHVIKPNDHPPAVSKGATFRGRPFLELAAFFVFRPRRCILPRTWPRVSPSALAIRRLDSPWLINSIIFSAAPAGHSVLAIVLRPSRSILYLA